MSMTGTWEVTIKSPMGAQRAILELVREGDSVTGSGRAMGNTMDVIEGVAEGERATFAVLVTKPVAMRLRFDLTFNGDDATGHVVAGMFGKQPVAGRRTS